MEGEELGLLGGEGSDSGGVAEEEISGGDGGEETFIEGEAEAQEGEGRQQEEGGAEGEEGERRPGDAKAFPVELRKAFRELSAANPDFQKRFPGAERKITAALFKAGEADKMGGLQNLRAASELVESHGGRPLARSSPTETRSSSHRAPTFLSYPSPAAPAIFSNACSRATAPQHREKEKSSRSPKASGDKTIFPAVCASYPESRVSTHTNKQESGGIAIINARYSEVWLDRFRETHGHGQGSRLSGQAESRDAGLNITAPTTAD